MILSPELIEKAAAEYRCEDPHCEICLRDAINAVLPDIRKEVLEEAAKECRSVAERAGNDQDDYFFGKSSGAIECDLRIRSLMEKEE